MKILTKYILKESFLYFGGCLVIFTGILLTGRMLKFANLIVNKGVLFSQIASVFLAVVPTFLEFAIPLAALLGVMLAFARLSGDSEIVVIRASGISLSQLVKCVVIFGVVCSALSYYVSTELRPWGYRHLSKTLFEIARTKSTAGLTEGIFNDLGKITLYANKIDHATGFLQKVLIDDRRNTASREIITATRGRIQSDAEHRKILLHLVDGQIHELVEGKYSLTDFDRNKLALSTDELYGDDSSKPGRRNRELYSNEINSTIESIRDERELRKSGAAASAEFKDLDDSQLLKVKRSLLIERGRRWSMPFAALVLVLVAMPLGIQPPRAQRAWGAGLSVALGMVVFLIYYGILSIGIALAESGVWHPYLGLWLPNLVSLAVGLLFIRQMGTEKWQSITQGLEFIGQRSLGWIRGRF